MRMCMCLTRPPPRSALGLLFGPPSASSAASSPRVPSASVQCSTLVQPASSVQFSQTSRVLVADRGRSHVIVCVLFTAVTITSCSEEKCLYKSSIIAVHTELLCRFTETKYAYMILHTQYQVLTRLKQ